MVEFLKLMVVEDLSWVDGRPTRSSKRGGASKAKLSNVESWGYEKVGIEMVFCP